MSKEVNKDEKVEEVTTDEVKEVTNETSQELTVKDEKKEIETKNENDNKITVGVKEDSLTKVKKINKKSLKTLIICGSILLFFVIVFGIIVCVNKLNSKVYKNVYLEGQNLSGMTKDEVSALIKEKNDKIKNKAIVVYQDSDELYTVNAEELDFSIDSAKTLTNIMGFGRSNNIFKDNFNIIKALFSKVDMDLVYSYDEEKFDGILKNIDLTIKNRAVDDTYSVDDKEGLLIITRGKTGNAIDYNKEKENIIEALKNSEDNKLKLNIISKVPQELDIDKVYSEVKREAKDAYVDENVKPIKFVSEVVGLDFDINELKNVLNNAENKQEGKVIEFKLKVTNPKVKLADLTSKYYNDKLAGKTTYFNASQTARANNLRIALDYLNGTIIMPGETFSYNATIGDTTAAKGYMAAATFKGGTVVNEMGGGICQTTSTLYNAALMANLQIVERHQHGLPVGYVQPSLDATVYSPMLDFKFKNTRNYPIKIVTSFSAGGSLNVSIYGTKEDNECEVTLSSRTLSTIPYTTKYIYDNSMADGKQVVVQNGVNGYVSEGYITKTQNGKVIESRMLSKDTYNPEQQVVKVGTKKSAS